MNYTTKDYRKLGTTTYEVVLYEWGDGDLISIGSKECMSAVNALTWAGEQALKDELAEGEYQFEVHRGTYVEESGWVNAGHGERDYVRDAMWVRDEEWWQHGYIESGLVRWEAPCS